MLIREMAYEEFEDHLESLRPEVSDLQYDEWRSQRDKLAILLGGLGKEDPGCGNSGDYLVDMDWFRRRSLAVSLIAEHMYDPILLRSIQKFLAHQRQSYVVTIVGDFPVNPILFECALSQSEAFFTFGEKGRHGYEEMAHTDPVVRHWLDAVFRLVL